VEHICFIYKEVDQKAQEVTVGLFNLTRPSRTTITGKLSKQLLCKALQKTKALEMQLRPIYQDYQKQLQKQMGETQTF